MSRCLTVFDVRNFVLERFAELKSKKQMRELIQFHSINKYLLMAHDPNGLKILGNLVANHEKIPFKKLLFDYETQLNETLEKNPTVGSNSNVLYHIFGHFSKDLQIEEKNHFLDLLEQYHSKKISLHQILTEMKSIVSRLDKTYLIRQTFFLFNINTTRQNLS